MPSLEVVDFDLRDWTCGVKEPRDPESFGDDDEMADFLGELVVLMVARRIARCSFLLRGWPLRMVGILAGEEEALNTIAAFKSDLAAWRAANAQPESEALKRILKRSCFNDVAVQQLVQVGCVGASIPCICVRPPHRWQAQRSVCH